VFAPVDMYAHELSRFRSMSWSQAGWVLTAWASARGLAVNGGAWGNMQGAQIGARIAFRGRRSVSVDGAIVGAFSHDGRHAVTHVKGSLGDGAESMARLDAALHEVLAAVTASGR
jgi:hypothetical protein